MMLSWNGRIALILVATLALSACGAGGAGVNPTPFTASAAKGKHHGKGRLVFRIKIPKKHHHRAHLAHGRDGKPHYISAATKGLTLSLSGPQGFTSSETVSLMPNATGCTSSLASVQCTLTIPNLQACPGTGNCYTASIETWDAVTSCPSNCTIPDSANELSANETIPFNVAAAQANMISATLDGIPNNVVLVPAIDSSLNGSPYGGFTLSKCGSDRVNVFATDADDNYILGAGAPVPALQSDSPKLIVATPAPETPNTFTISRTNANLPPAGSSVNLNATVTPIANAQADPVSSGDIQMTFDASICGVVTFFPIPTSASAPRGIALGSDGNLWFTESATGKVGRVTTAGAITEYSTNIQPSAYLDDITLGPDGNMWFTDSANGYVGTIDPSGTISNYGVGASGPSGIASGPDMGWLWITETNSSKILITDTTGAQVDEVPTKTAASSPRRITLGPDGNLWFTEYSGNRIGQTGDDGHLTEFSVPTASSGPTDISNGPDGNLWFTEHDGNKIGTTTPGGAISEFPVPGGGHPTGITSGPDGNVYFTLFNAGKIGQITADGSGTITLFSTGLAGTEPAYITVGADNNIWFTECATGKIGRMQ